MGLKTIKYEVGSPIVNMGQMRLRQPFPSKGIEMIDPFLLLHHYGPYVINPFDNPFDLDPHPHRGFEPITLLFKGEQLHRDSLGNEILVKAGDVQWTTAGSGVIHAEGPSKEILEKGEELEGIQLWLNLPAHKKMIEPNYQHLKNEDISTIQDDQGNFVMKVIAGEQNGIDGKIATQTEVNVFTAEVKQSGKMTVEIPTHHESLVYLLDGEILVNNETILKKGASQMITFHQGGDQIELEGRRGSHMLILSGAPIKEKVISWGPYVMNTQTEIMEALLDYQSGKMGYLS